MFQMFAGGDNVNWFLVLTTSMPARPVSRWRSIVSHRIRGKSGDYFCAFQKVKPAPYGRGNAPVFLNVYDLTAVNDYFYWSGIGVFHSGVEGRWIHFFITGPRS